MGLSELSQFDEGVCYQARVDIVTALVCADMVDFEPRVHLLVV